MLSISHIYLTEDFFFFFKYGELLTRLVFHRNPIYLKILTDKYLVMAANSFNNFKLIF